MIIRTDAICHSGKLGILNEASNASTPVILNEASIASDIRHPDDGSHAT